MGLGDADFICSAMNLPSTFGFWSIQGKFGVGEEMVGIAETDTTALGMKEACQEEIYQTLNVHEQGDWADKGFSVVEQSYCSISGHAFCIGGNTKTILDNCVKSKVCNVCNRAMWYKKPIKEHVCPKNHVTGSSKTLESDAVVEMIYYRA